jgi:hypothetical protein
MQIRNLLAAALLFSMTVAAAPALAATHEVTKKPTTTTLQVSTHQLNKGQKGTLTVKVTPKTTGVVVLEYRELPSGKWDSYGVIPFTDGAGVGKREAPEVGVFDVRVVYNGSKSLLPSTSNIEKVTVTK